MKTLAALVAVSCALGGLAGCEKQLEAPTEARRVLAPRPAVRDSPPKFNKLADHQVDLEHCAAQLERMRINFRALGKNDDEVIGAYQGQYLFDDDTGVATSQTLKGHPYSLMVRSGDGRLVVPGAMPQQ